MRGRSLAWAALACLLLTSLCVHGEEDGAERPNFAKLKVKELKSILSERGVECKGCAEKSDFVKLAEESYDLPIKEAKPEAKDADPPPKMDDAELQEMLRKMQAETGMKMNMFKGDDLKNLSPEQMAKMFGGDGGKDEL